MAKINFTKIEEAVEEGLRKMTAANLLKLTDQHPHDQSKNRGQACASIFMAIEWFRKKGIDIAKEFGTTHAQIKSQLTNADKLSDQEWNELLNLKKKLRERIKRFDDIATGSDDDLVAKERKRHINKRFNINEKWLPLK